MLLEEQAMRALGLARQDPVLAPALEALPTPHAPPPVSDPPPSPLTVEVTLNGRDAATVRSMAEDDYRTPAQQVGYLVSQWLKIHQRVGAGASTTPQPPAVNGYAAATNGHAPAPTTPAPPVEPPAGLMPIYHVGDGTAGSGCGKVGLLCARRLEGRIAPGDVFHAGKMGAPACHHEKVEGALWGGTDGALTCCQCGGAMSPASWSYADDDTPVRKTVPDRVMARMENPAS